MTAPNSAQIESIIRWMLAAGGPAASLLVARGADATDLQNITNLALLIVPPLVSIVWSMFAKTDKQLIGTAAAVPGVEGVKIAATATGGAAAAAADPKLTNVN